MTAERWQKDPARDPALDMMRSLASLVEQLAAQGTAAGPGLPATPEPGEERQALRALTGAARGGSLRCHVDAAGLQVNGHVLLPEALLAEHSLFELARRMADHDVGTLTVRQGAARAELLALARLLAEPPRLPAHLAAGVHPQTEVETLRSWSVLITPARAPDVIQAPVSHRVAAVIAHLHAARTDDAARQPVAQLLELAAELEGRRDGAALEAIAAALVQHTRDVGAGAGRLATEGGLRRLLREPVVVLLAARVPESSDRDMLVAVLARTGEMGGRILVAELLASADSLGRRSYFDAIVTQHSGVAQLLEALGDPRWYVVRNAAALLGEMHVVEAEASLVPLLAHADDRIRIAASRALTRLRTAGGVAALQQGLRDAHPEVRRLAAAAFGLSTTIPGVPRPHSAPLGTALATEVEEDVRLELLAALGKLASPDAVQRLVRVAIGGPGQAGQASWFRVAALEALVAARGHAAVPTLQLLAGDADGEVAAAARRFLTLVHAP